MDDFSKSTSFYSECMDVLANLPVFNQNVWMFLANLPVFNQNVWMILVTSHNQI